LLGHTATIVFLALDDHAELVAIPVVRVGRLGALDFIQIRIDPGRVEPGAVDPTRPRVEVREDLRLRGILTRIAVGRNRVRHDQTSLVFAACDKEDDEQRKGREETRKHELPPEKAIGKRTNMLTLSHFCAFVNV